MSKRVLIIGLDGATWTVFDRYFAKGLMPNLKRLVAAGRRAVMRSTRPANTPVAWSTMTTGTNPGKHGVYGFGGISLDRPVWNTLPSSGATVHQPGIWRLLSDAGLTTSVVNVPFTYPPEEVSGAFVSGMDTPPDAKRFATPAAVQAELERMKYAIDYDLALETGSYDEAVARERLAGDGAWFFNRAREVTQRRADAMEMLLKRGWDFFMGVFVGPDRLMHIYWDYLFDDSLPQDDPHSEAIHRNVMGYWAVLDEAIGRIAGHADDNTVIGFTSDHGFCKACGEFYLNYWLMEHGWLAPRRTTMLKRAARAAKKVGLNPFRMTAKITGRTRAQKLAHAHRGLDWKNTRAYCRGDCLIALNVRGREVDGCVEPGAEYDRQREELREQLLDMRDPAGKRILENVYRREELYHGPFLDYSADLIIQPAGEVRYTYYWDALQPPGTPRPLEILQRGTHHPDGIMAFTGGGVTARAEAAKTDILDFAPTVMHLLGLPVPEHFDGRVALEVIEGATDGSVTKSAYAVEEGSGKSEYTQEQVRAIEERLRGLGYME